MESKNKNTAKPAKNAARIGIDFTDGNQRERFLGVAVECTRFFAQYVVPSSVINVRVACNGLWRCRAC